LPLAARVPSNPLNTGNRQYDQSVKLTLKAVQWVGHRRIAPIPAVVPGRVNHSFIKNC
jgi:hypothetical protein